MLEKDGMASSNRDEMTTTKLRVETLGSQLRQYQKEVGIGADSTTTTPKHVVNYTTTNIQFLKELLSNVENCLASSIPSESFGIVPKLFGVISFDLYASCKCLHGYSVQVSGLA
jgi:hypothetical protein